MREMRIGGVWREPVEEGPPGSLTWNGNSESAAVVLVAVTVKEPVTEWRREH